MAMLGYVLAVEEGGRTPVRCNVVNPVGPNRMADRDMGASPRRRSRRGVGLPRIESTRSLAVRSRREIAPSLCGCWTGRQLRERAHERDGGHRLVTLVRPVRLYGGTRATL